MDKSKQESIIKTTVCQKLESFQEIIGMTGIKSQRREIFTQHSYVSTLHSFLYF